MIPCHLGTAAIETSAFILRITVLGWVLATITILLF